MVINGLHGKYTGEINKKGEAHGKGTFSYNHNLWHGTFHDNNLDSYFYLTTPSGYIHIGEMRNGKWHGKKTVYFPNQREIKNEIYIKGKLVHSTIVAIKEAWFRAHLAH